MSDGVPVNWNCWVVRCGIGPQTRTRRWIILGPARQCGVRLAAGSEGGAKALLNIVAAGLAAGHLLVRFSLHLYGHPVGDPVGCAGSPSQGGYGHLEGYCPEGCEQPKTRPLGPVQEVDPDDDIQDRLYYAY